MSFRLILFVLLLGGDALGTYSVTFGNHAKHPEPVYANCLTAVFHSPHGEVLSEVVWRIKAARRSINVAMYGLTHPILVDALVLARRRGVDVIVKLDKVQSGGKGQIAAIKKLRAAKVTIEISNRSRLLHHKFAVIDQATVLTGSYNWTLAAENRNRENLVVLHCPRVADQFLNEWNLIKPHEP